MKVKPSTVHRMLLNFMVLGTKSGIKEIVGSKGVSGVERSSPKGMTEVKKSTTNRPIDAGIADNFLII